MQPNEMRLKIEGNEITDNSVPNDTTAYEIVTGQLIRIDFQEKKITIRYPINNRALDCFYEESLEDTLLENRRQLIQVTGIVSLDENDYPKKIVSASSIEEVDLSPVYISEAIYNRVRIFLNSPLELFPKLTEDKQYRVIDREELGINVIAKSRKELLDELNEIIYVIWKEYVEEKEEVLVPQAIEFKKTWEKRIKTIYRIR